MHGNDPCITRGLWQSDVQFITCGQIGQERNHTSLQVFFFFFFFLIGRSHINHLTNTTQVYLIVMHREAMHSSILVDDYLMKHYAPETAVAMVTQAFRSEELNRQRHADIAERANRASSVDYLRC